MKVLLIGIKKSALKIISEFKLGESLLLLTEAAHTMAWLRALKIFRKKGSLF
jgi:hypothetical protein